VVQYRKKVVFENLKNSFPEKSQIERNQIARKFYKYFCQLMVETVKLVSISEKEFKKRVWFKNPEILDDLYKKGLSGVVITAHYGNWEWFAAITDKDRNPFHCMSIYKPLSNKQVEEVVNRCRTRFGADVVPMKQTIKVMVGYKKKNLQTLSLFIADQSPMRSHIQYWTQFLNQPTPIYLGPEKIAKSLGMAVIMMIFKETEKRGYYEIEISKFADDLTSFHEHELTEWHVKKLESVIRERPEYWLWSHRRWKHKPE
jgi:KDO2-lipid IV(A) lauroyltransferase